MHALTFLLLAGVTAFALFAVLKRRLERFEAHLKSKSRFILGCCLIGTPMLPSIVGLAFVDASNNMYLWGIAGVGYLYVLVATASQRGNPRAALVSDLMFVIPAFALLLSPILLFAWAVLGQHGPFEIIATQGDVLCGRRIAGFALSGGSEEVRAWKPIGLGLLRVYGDESFDFGQSDPIPSADGVCAQFLGGI